ncbi:hypothetical protein DE146DRAFT_526451 [Phaeosphaeria sp. MPI-PUGE-AT-0046c]|nr:hypothetical protein DE146DRAFT_526451 [Phaeosphaeria sp. MPI-PUGE-AT-0046c]
MPKRRFEETVSQQICGEHAAAAPTSMHPMTNEGGQSAEEYFDDSEPKGPDIATINRRSLASIACNPCRERKVKCDEQRPVCGACVRLKLTCKIDTLLESMSKSLQQLERTTSYITTKLESQTTTNASFPSPPTSGLTLPCKTPSPQPHSIRSRSEYKNGRLQQFQDLSFPQFSHITALHEIYAWPHVAKAVPNVDMTYPVTAERSRDPLTPTAIAPHCLVSSTQEGQTDWCDSMNILQVRTLISHYLNDLYQVYPIVEKRKILDFCTSVTIEKGFSENAESCVILIVLALGSFVAYFKGQTEWGHDGMNDPDKPVGVGFFNKARQILAILPKGHIETAQCQVLAGYIHTLISPLTCQTDMTTRLYYAQILRIYDFWSSIHEAAVTLVNIINTSSAEKTSPSVTRGYWVTYILECTILAELDLPPSGLHRLQDIVPMPFGHDEPQTQEQNSDAECHFVLLANIALRRLLNRAFRGMYPSDLEGDVPRGTVVASTTVAQELATQLESWFSHLPPSIATQMRADDTRIRQKFPENNLGLLRGRYWAAKFVVYRPFVYKSLSHPPHTLTAEDYFNLEQCLEAGLQVSQEVGLLTENARLMVSPFAPIRSFMATYTLLCAIQDVPHLRHFAVGKQYLAEEIRRKIELEFRHLSPLVENEMELLERYNIYLESRQITE